jgi:hypothetical protein
MEYCHKKKDCVQREKYDFISPRAICFPNCESEKVIAWPKRGKIHRGKEYHIFPPVRFFVLFLA